MEPAWEKTAGLKFQLGSYKDLNGQLRPCYSLTKTECLYIATKFNDEARAKLVLRWQELHVSCTRFPDTYEIISYLSQKAFRFNVYILLKKKSLKRLKLI